MALTAVQVQQVILLDLGQDTPDGKLAANIGTLWQLYAGKAAIWPDLQRQYVKRHCLDVLLGVERGKVDTTMADLSVRYSQKVANLETLRADVQAEILRLEERARGARGVQVGQIAQTSPDPPPDQIPAFPPNLSPAEGADVYQGSPYYSLLGPESQRG